MFEGRNNKEELMIYLVWI